jgi:hypothetical protein
MPWGQNTSGWGQAANAVASGSPWGAGIGALGSLLGGLASGPQDQYIPQMRVGSQNQLGLLEQLIRQARSGQGEYGFGAASRQGMATMRQQMGNMGHQAGSPVWNSALAQILSQAGAMDAGNRRQFALQTAQAQPWTYQQYVRQPG